MSTVPHTASPFWTYSKPCGAVLMNSCLSVGQNKVFDKNCKKSLSLSNTFVIHCQRMHLTCLTLRWACSACLMCMPNGLHTASKPYNDFLFCLFCLNHQWTKLQIKEENKPIVTTVPHPPLSVLPGGFLKQLVRDSEKETKHKEPEVKEERPVSHSFPSLNILLNLKDLSVANTRVGLQLKTWLVV